MKPDFECSATASFLESGRVLSITGHAGAVVAAIGSAFAHTLPIRIIFAASILCWLMECWLAVRVAIDARLFRALAEDPEHGGNNLDELLTGWGLRRRPKQQSMADRSRGAIALWRRQVAILVIQLSALAVAVVLHALGF